MSTAFFLIVLLHARKDDDLCAELRKHLSVLARARKATLWDRSDTQPGENSADVATSQLAKASLVVVLVSADYLHDHHEELQAALSLHAPNRKSLIPVLLRPCPWEHTDLAGLEPLPNTRRAVSEHANRDVAWKEVVGGIAPLLDCPRTPSVSAPSEPAEVPVPPAPTALPPGPDPASLSRPEPPKAPHRIEIAPTFKIQKMYRDGGGHVYRHDYLGTVRLSNRSNSILRVWSIEVEVPGFLAHPRGKAGNLRDEHARYRLTSDDKPEPLYPGDSADLMFTYTMDDDIYWATRGSPQRPFHIRVFIDDTLVDHQTVPFGQMQNF